MNTIHQIRLFAAIIIAIWGFITVLIGLAMMTEQRRHAKSQRPIHPLDIECRDCNARRGEWCITERRRHPSANSLFIHRRRYIQAAHRTRRAWEVAA